MVHELRDKHAEVLSSRDAVLEELSVDRVRLEGQVRRLESASKDVTQQAEAAEEVAKGSASRAKLRGGPLSARGG